jgi:hypothetical protein
MNDLSNCTPDDTFDVTYVREACRMRRKELEAFKEIHRRRSEKLQALLSGCTHLAGSDEKLEGPSLPLRRRHSVAVPTTTTSVPLDRSYGSPSSSKWTSSATDKHSELATTHSEDCLVQQRITEPIRKKGLEDIRRGIQQRRQQRLQLFRSIGTSESDNIHGVSNGNSIAESPDEEDNDALYF